MKNDKTPTPNSRLRDARRALGWSQQELADQVGTTSVTISRWENGKTFPTPYFRQQLCKVFDKTPAELGLAPLSPPGSTIWSLPHARNPFFIGREQLLALLHKRLSTARTAALTQTQSGAASGQKSLTPSTARKALSTQTQALSGLGGIGKTQTAIEYAFHYADDYTHVFWMLAASRETLVADCVTLAHLLDLPEKEQQDQQLMVDAVKAWLAAHEGWLLILDSADDLPLARKFLPTRHKGSVLLTTRAQAAGAIAASIEVEQLTLQEGTLLLLYWSKLLDLEAPLEQVQAADRVAAELIVGQMDGLPLAIVQAGAYVQETGCSLEDYLRLYSIHRKDVLAWHSRLLDYTKTVATTWSLSFQQVEQESPAAAEVLRLCAFLAPDAIPEELLTRGAAELGTILEATARDEFKLNQALEVLRRYSLLRRDGNTHLLSIHPLVQTVLRESMEQQTQRTWAERTVRATSVAFPQTNAGPGHTQQSYLPHAQQCATLIKQYQLHFPEAAQLLHQTGAVLYFHGFHPQSHSLHHQALALREQVFGSDHPAIAESLNALALLARTQEDYQQAEGFHLRALAIREKMLGPEHPATALSLNNLGVLYRTQGKYEQAEQLLEQALGIRKQLLGSEHTDTLHTFLNLAKLYTEQHKYAQAKQLLQQALAICERTLEPGHPLIAHTLNLLARLSYEQGNYQQAETLWQRSLALIEQTHGPEHPVTAEQLNNLAELRVAQGRYQEAQSLCQRAVNICEKRLGSQHPDTIAYRKHLARIMSKREGEQDDGHHPTP